VRLPAGAYLLLMVGSANRDEAAFAEPERVDLQRRDEARLLSFGAGIHRCIGAALARLEGRVALEVARERLPNLAFAPEAEPEYIPSFLLRGVRRLDATWRRPA